MKGKSAKGEPKKEGGQLKFLGDDGTRAGREGSARTCGLHRKILRFKVIAGSG